MTIHTFKGHGAPTFIPPSENAHYLDLDTKTQYLATGTTKPSDWVALALNWVTAEGTTGEGLDDTESLPGIARRVAYMLPAKVAVGPALTAGVNVIALSAFAGDAVDPKRFTGFTLVGYRAGVLVELAWQYLPETGQLRIEGGVAGDVPLAVEHEVGGGDVSNAPVTVAGITKSLAQWVADDEGSAALASQLAADDDPAKGAALIGYKGGSVASALSDLFGQSQGGRGYQELVISSGTLAIDAAAAAAFGVLLTESVENIDLAGAVAGQRTRVHIYFKQPDEAGGKTVALPNSIRMPSSGTASVATDRSSTTLISIASVDGGASWTLENSQVYHGVAMDKLPALSTENSTFNDEGDSASGWSPSNATITSSGSYLRQTKQAAGSNSSMTKPIFFTPASSDFILYGKVRAKYDANSTAVIWLLNGSKEISIWLGSAVANPAAAQGAVSICGTTGTGTRNITQVASGYNYEATPLDFALQFDQKFSTLTCWFRESDGRWKFRGRVACDWFSSSDIQVLTTTSSAAGAWVEFDYLMLARPNLAVLSDSIGEGKTLFSPNPSLGLTNDESTWMRHAPIYPNLRNNLIVNKGVGGQSSAQILARVTDVTSTGARVVFLHASSNDEAAGVSQSQRTSNVQSTISAMAAAGQAVVVLNAVYATQASTDNTSPRSLMTYARDWWNNGRNTVTGVSAAIDIMDALRSSGSDYMDPAKTQSDGIHPNIAGHALVGGYIESFV